MSGMLEPGRRQLYLEPLIPPAGYEVDLAVATTYSLDLVALLMAPVAMAFGSLDVEEDGLPDPVQALASLQKVARRMTVFCQQAQIAAPRQYSRLFAMLEPVVAEVQAPNGGVFHPKTWLVRYRATDDPKERFYRLVVLSRNLTLDRAWDTMLAMDGWLTDTERNFREPLVDFVAALPDLCVTPLDGPRKDAIRALAAEMSRVWFERPHRVARKRYRPIGVGRYESLLTGWADRRLVISPFLSDATVCTLFEDVRDSVLISRAEALDGLSDETMDVLAGQQLYYWRDDRVEDEAAEDEATEDADAALTVTEPAAGETLHGLHAKVILTERGDKVRLTVGSANATDAAFGGHNVEFCVELRGDREDIGIDRVLPPADDGIGGEASLRDMIVPYQRPDEPERVDDTLQRRLDSVRRELASLQPSLRIVPAGEDRWDLVVEAGDTSGAAPEGAEVECWPISLEREWNLQDASGLWQGDPVVFTGVSLATLTTFMLFEIKVEDEATRFVMNLPLHGGTMPDQRQDRLLASLLEDSDGFLRYLLMLLWEDADVDLEAIGVGGWRRSDGHGWGVDALPLLEELVAAFSARPERLDEIDDLMRRLMATPEGSAIVPAEFAQLWRAFEEARQLRD